MSHNIKNILTIDVEDYFQINAFSDVISYKDWDSFESRVEKNTYQILDLIDSVGGTQNPEPKTQNPKPSSPKATFFILGWIAERYPDLVKEIHKRGHEIACHGYAHQLIFNQDRNVFKEDVKRAKDILEDITGESVIGYRAPTYTITKRTMWALEVLHELGFKYDSSIFPITHDVYGYPGTPRFPYLVVLNDESSYEFISRDDHNYSSYKDKKNIVEFPISTFRAFNKNIPVGGGRLFQAFSLFINQNSFKKNK